MSGPLEDVAGVLENQAGLLGASLAQWAYRDEAADKAAGRQAANTAMDAFDGMLAALHHARAALVAEIRQADDATAVRVDAMLAATVPEDPNGGGETR